MFFTATESIEEVTTHERFALLSRLKIIPKNASVNHKGIQVKNVENVQNNNTEVMTAKR